VIADAKGITVRLSTGETYGRAYLLADDKQRDIAILRIDASDLPVLQLGNSNDIKLGEDVLLIGAPRGLEQTVSNGIISSIRVLENGNKVIQTTAPASHGSSGGPLINRQGQVIGLLTFSVETGQNLNFAIPANYAKGMLEALPLSAGSPITVFDSKEANAGAHETPPNASSTPTPSTSPSSGADKRPASDAAAPTLAIIWFFRTKSATDSMLNPTLHAGGVPLARLEKGQYFGIAVKPGTHYFSWTDRPKLSERASVTVQAGDQFFFQVRWRAIVPAQTQVWNKELPNLRPIEGKDIFNSAVLRGNDPRLSNIRQKR
jgi:hypothetical protein